METALDPAYKRGKIFIISGFILFILTVLICFVTVRFILPDGEPPARGILGIFAGTAILSVLLELVGMITLIRANKRSSRE